MKTGRRSFLRGICIAAVSAPLAVRSAIKRVEVSPKPVVECVEAVRTYTKIDGVWWRSVWKDQEKIEEVIIGTKLPFWMPYEDKLQYFHENMIIQNAKV